MTCITIRAMIRTVVCMLALAAQPVWAQVQYDENGVALTDEYGNLLDRPDIADDAIPQVVMPDAATGQGGVVRVLDKINGSVTDLELGNGETGALGSLSITLSECRYPAANPAGDAYELLTIHYRDAVDPLFRGWMIASAPALNAMDHPRYDVWALRCMTS